MSGHTVPERPSNLAAIQACTMLNALSEEERETLAVESFMAYAERGEMIWMAGSSPGFIAVVGVGFVKMTKATTHGQEVSLELLGPGQCLGLLAAVEGRSYPLSAVAVTNTWYLKIPTSALLPIYRGNPQMQDSVVRSIGPRLRKAHEMMIRLSSGRIEERLAAVLFILSDSYGNKTADGIQLQVPLTRQDLAEMSGTTVETAIRIMSKWQKDGFVNTEKQVITIVNEEGLANSLLH